MEIVNRANVDPNVVKSIAARFGLIERPILIFLDDVENRILRDEAANRIAFNRSRGWPPNTQDLETIAGDNDHHAFFCASELLQAQGVPVYVKQFPGDHDSILYLDSVFLKEANVEVISTLAHECRHAWQFYTAPLIYFADIILKWVVDPKDTPAEVDAETFAKRVAIEFCETTEVTNYAKQKLQSCPENHRVFWQRFLGLDAELDVDVSEATQRTLLANAAKLRQVQEELGIEIPLLEKAASYLAPAEAKRFLEAATKH